MKKPALTADRTVAFDRFYLSLSFNLEPDPAAMASPAVFDQVNLELFYGPTGLYIENKLLGA
jgi:hypothetical protein